MGNLGNGIKKFLQNKNTVTVVGIVIVIVVLFFAYNYRVDRSTNPISVPYATEEIKSGVQITENMVGTTQITGTMADQLGIIRRKAEVIDRYSNADTILTLLGEPERGLSLTTETDVEGVEAEGFHIGRLGCHQSTEISYQFCLHTSGEGQFLTNLLGSGL